MNREYLIQEAKKYKRIDSVSLVCEDFLSDKRFLGVDYECESCSYGKVDTLSHWQECVSYSKLRISRNLDSDLDLVNYYQDLIKMRLSNSEKKQEQESKDGHRDD